MEDVCSDLSKISAIMDLSNTTGYILEDIAAEMSNYSGFKAVCLKDGLNKTADYCFNRIDYGEVVVESMTQALASEVYKEILKSAWKEMVASMGAFAPYFLVAEAIGKYINSAFI